MPGTKIDFKEAFHPDKFFFGVANAPYLCEGGYNYPHGIKNSYAFMEMDGKHERSGEAVRFWEDYEYQVKLAASLGLNAFRMGVDWARVQPSISLEPHDPPSWDYSAVERYARIIGMVITHGMQPIITLHHFTHPAWVGLEMWLDDRGPDLLAEYQVKVVEEINNRLMRDIGKVMSHFLIYNEPGLVPLIYHWTDYIQSEKKGPEYLVTAYDNMMSRYVRVYDGLYDLFEHKGWGIPHIGVTSASNCAYELDKINLDLLRLRSFGIKRQDAEKNILERRAAWYKWVDPLARDKLDSVHFEQYKGLIALTAEIMKPSLLEKTMTALYTSPRPKKLDYLSINVYEPFFIAKGSADMVEMPKWWDYAMDGDVYYTFIKASNEFNNDLPFYLGENNTVYRYPINGKAEPRPDSWNRERYMKTYWNVMLKCMQEGVPIRGYLWWSLVDDFEWDAGFEPRMGLFNYAYINHRVLETDGLGELAARIYAELIALLRSGDKRRIKEVFPDITD